MEDCVFCQIAQGKKAAVKVYEDESVLAFLDRQPINPGHILVIPKTHVEELYEMGEELYNHTMTVVQRMARELKTKFSPPRVGLWVHGFEVPHAHIHVVPLHKPDDISANRGQLANDQELAEIAKQLETQ